MPAYGGSDSVAPTEAISASMVELYARFYGDGRTTRTTYINDNIVVCVLEDILSEDESSLIAAGSGNDVIDGRVACQEGMQDEFTETPPAPTVAGTRA